MNHCDDRAGHLLATDFEEEVRSYAYGRAICCNLMNKRAPRKKLGTLLNLCFSFLAALNKMDNSDAMTHFIAPCYERKSTSFNSCEVFRGAQARARHYS